MLQCLMFVNSSDRHKGTAVMDDEYAPLPSLQTGVRGLYPRCGTGHMFTGFLPLRPRCEVCGLYCAFADPADGSGFFVICFACMPSVLLALWLEVSFDTSWLTQVLVTGAFMLLTCIPPLRPLKGWLVASQYFYKAEEGRLSNPELNDIMRS